MIGRSGRGKRLAPAAAVLAVGRVVLAVPVGYLSVVTAAAWWATLRHPGRRPAGPKATTFALVVPAHDEEAVIGDTLQAIANLDYPNDRYCVHVVADHCADRTVEIAKSKHAEVHEHVGAARGKGPALQWAITPLLDSADVFVIVDADTIVDPGFLTALDREFAEGAAAVQGQYRVRHPGGSTGAGLRAAALALRHHLRPLGRTALGASSGLYGNGMAFTADVLRRRTWTEHLTEDIEFQMELLLAGTLVRYAPDAVVEAEMPATLAGAETQNERWERGRLDLARRYIPRLVRVARDDPRRRIAALDGVLDHVVPPLSVLAAATGGVAVASTAVALIRGRGWRRSGWLLVAALADHVVSGLLLARAPLAVWRSLAHAPAMVVWKVRLWLRMLVRPGSVGWVRTRRAAESEGAA